MGAAEVHVPAVSKDPFSQVFVVGDDQARLYGFPVTSVKIFLCRSIVFFCIKFPEEHIFDAFHHPRDGAGEEAPLESAPDQCGVLF